MKTKLLICSRAKDLKTTNPADLRVIVGGAFAEILEFSPDSSTLLTPDEYPLEKDRKRALIEQRTQEFFDTQLIKTSYLA